MLVSQLKHKTKNKDKVTWSYQFLKDMKYVDHVRKADFKDNTTSFGEILYRQWMGSVDPAKTKPTSKTIFLSLLCMQHLKQFSLSRYDKNKNSVATGNLSIVPQSGELQWSWN